MNPKEGTMIERYQTVVMQELWSEEAKFHRWVQVEAAVLSARAALGYVNLTVPDDLADRIVIDPRAIAEIEKRTDHDVVAFLEHTSAQIPDELRPWWHHLMTSMDAQDTALFMALRDSVDVIVEALDTLMEILRRRAWEFKDTAMMGRTHGIHAEPITFGAKLARFYDECARQRKRLELVREEVSVGKVSGVVGMYTLPPEVERRACEKLGLRPVISSQIIDRDIIASYMTTLANVAGMIERIALQIRLLATTEIREVEEYFAPDQKGSSAMPHKRNPKGVENLCGLSRLIRGYAMVALEDQQTFHERSIDNSGPERVIIPDASHIAHFIVRRCARILDKLVVYPERMLQNMQMLKGLCFSQDVQALVAEKSGVPREEAYGFVRTIAQRCWDTGEDFQTALIGSREVMQHISIVELRGCFDLASKLKYVDHIFKTVFG